MADAKHSNLEKVALLLNVAQTKFQSDSLSVGKKSLKVEQEIAGEDDDKREEQLDAINDSIEDIKSLLGKNGGGKGKEEQLQRVKSATGKSSITRVSGENATAILKTATENLANDLEKFSKEEHDMLTEIVKKIGELTEKNIEEYNKKSKELIDQLKKGQALAEKSGNKDLQKRLQDTEGQTREQLYKANKMDLRGSKDTFTNRFARTFGLKNEKGTHEFSDAKMGFKDKAKAFGTALKVGAKEAAGGFKTGILYGAKGSMREAITMSDTMKTRQFEKDNNLSKHIMRLDELDENDKNKLASRGIAPKSEKDISYRKDNKPVSKADINAEFAKEHEEKNAATAIIPEPQSKSEKVAAEIEKASDTGASASSIQEESAGLSQDPVVAALDEQTKKLDEISDTLSQANKLFEAIQSTIEKIAESSGEGGGSDSGSGSSGGSLLDNVTDIADDLTGSGGSKKKKTRSERARAQPRDAKGRFVRRGSPDAVRPRGRMGGKGKGLVGLGLGLLGAVGIGSAMSDDDSGTADVAANTAMTAADLAPSPTDAVKTEAKATEKAGVKGAEKAAAKGVGKVGAKGAAKVGAKALGKSLLKKIPGVGLLAGGVFAAQRAMSGDWKGAGLELASGAASTIPGVGTAASVGIDAALAARDMGAFGGAPGEDGAPGAAGGAGGAGGGGGAGGAGGAGGPGSGPMKQGPGKPAQGKSGGIFSKVGGFIKKNPLLAAGALGGVGLAAVGAKKAWDYFSGGSEEAAVQSGQNPDSAILEQGSEKARDKMNVNVPPPTVIQAPGQPAASTSEGSTPKMRGYVRDDESSWMRFALKRTMA